MIDGNVLLNVDIMNVRHWFVLFFMITISLVVIFMITPMVIVDEVWLHPYELGGKSSFYAFLNYLIFYDESWNYILN